MCCYVLLFCVIGYVLLVPVLRRYLMLCVGMCCYLLLVPRICRYVVIWYDLVVVCCGLLLVVRSSNLLLAVSCR